ncbi:MAG TPA: T9SS type B sorting domain-containing protein, partial [Chitinophagaceae bacterium]|nr:T9SS type B sorting domain-containing protein [Chitinophagaceae bacterium]
SGGGCVNTDTVLVKASIVDTSLRLNGKSAYCFDSGDSAVLKVPPAASIQWYRDNIAVIGANQPSYRVTQTGTYYALITSAEGCSLATSKQDVLIDHPRPGITYPIAYAVINLPITLEARNFGKTVLWQPAANLDNPTSLKPVFKGPEDQLYQIDITTTTGCLTVDTQLVKAIKSVEIYVPNAFTPNNDGHNDYLHPLLVGVKEIRYFRVFNRLGQLMFEMRNDGRGWDGVYKGQGQSTQTVVWVVEALGVDGNIYHKKGTSILLR